MRNKTIGELYPHGGIVSEHSPCSQTSMGRQITIGNCLDSEHKEIDELVAKIYQALNRDGLSSARISAFNEVFIWETLEELLKHKT